VGAEGEEEGQRNRVRPGGRIEKRGGMEKASREETKIDIPPSKDRILQAKT
jgi:hypothetical protein